MDTGSQELDELCDKRSAMKRSYSEELSSNTMADPSENKCYEFYLPKRYILAFMAFLGFGEYIFIFFIELSFIYQKEKHFNSNNGVNKIVLNSFYCVLIFLFSSIFW